MGASSKTTIPFAVVEDLRPEQWTKRPVGNRFSGTTSTIQRFQSHSHRGRRFLEVHLCKHLKRPDAPANVYGLIWIFTRHANVPNTILMEKGTAFTPEAVKQTMEQAGISIKHATIKHAQTMSMMKKNRQILKTILQINVIAEINFPRRTNNRYQNSMKRQ